LRWLQYTPVAFQRKVDIFRVFNKRDKLYKIEFETYVAREYSYDQGYSESKERTRQLSKDATEAYTQKYGKPTYLNLNAYPTEGQGSCPYVAQWTFLNAILVKMYVCRRPESGRSRIHVLN